MNMDFVIILGEALFIPVVLNVVFIIVLLKGRSKKKRALENLTKRMIETKPSQEALAKEFLEKIGNDDGDIINQKNTALSELRVNFLVSLIDGVLQNDEEKLTDIVDQLNELTAHIMQQEIKLSEPVVDVAESELNENAFEEINELKSENKELKREMHKTLQTLNNMFAEYSSMFGEEIDTTDMSVEEIIEAMAAISERALGESTETASGDIELDDEPVVASEQESELTSEEPTDDESESVESIDEELANEAPEEEENSEAEDPSWDDAFAEAGDFNDEDQPSWDDAFAEEEPSNSEK